jgi:formiminotetrahydrofolate cyclodeaminase
MNNKLVNMPIKDFCNELASSSPAPGGGSTGALAGALAASLATMVTNLTIGKKKYREVEEKMQGIKEEAESLMSKMLILIDDDTNAFNKVMDAFRMPKGSQDEKTARSKAIQDAMKGASEVPLEIAKLSVKIASLCNKVAKEGNENAVTDAGVGARLCEASYFAGVYNVRINLTSIKDKEYVERTNNVLDELLNDLRTHVNPVYEIVDKL